MFDFVLIIVIALIVITFYALHRNATIEQGYRPNSDIDRSNPPQGHSPDRKDI